MTSTVFRIGGDRSAGAAHRGYDPRNRGVGDEAWASCECRRTAVDGDSVHGGQPFHRFPSLLRGSRFSQFSHFCRLSRGAGAAGARSRLTVGRGGDHLAGREAGRGLQKGAVPPGEAAPATSDVAVLRRNQQVGTGDLAWMPDANTYCLLSIRERASDRQCFGLATKRKPQGYVHVGRGRPHGFAEPGQMWLTVSIVENAGGPFAYTGGTPEHATPVQEATVKFPSGRTMTFLTYEFPEGRSIPPDAEICSTGRAVCFKAFEPTPQGE